MLSLNKLVVSSMDPLFVGLEFLLIKGVRFRIVLRIGMVKFAGLFVCVILRAGFGDDVFLELLVGVVGMAREGSALLEILENVDHSLIIIDIKLIVFVVEAQLRLFISLIQIIFFNNFFKLSFTTFSIKY